MPLLLRHLGSTSSNTCCGLRFTSNCHVVALSNLLNHLKVLGDHSRALLRSLLYIWILSVLRFVLELLQVLFMILDHRLDVGFIELRPRESFEFCHKLLVFLGRPLGFFDTKLLCDRLHLIAELRVVLHHPLPKLLNILTLRLLLCQLSELYLSSAAFKRFFDKSLIGHPLLIASNCIWPHSSSTWACRLLAGHVWLLLRRTAGLLCDSRRKCQQHGS